MSFTMRDDIEQRRAILQRVSDRTAAQEARFGATLDGMDGDRLRELFDVAFGQLAEFEWTLRVRRGRVYKPQRAALLEVLHRQEATAR